MGTRTAPTSFAKITIYSEGPSAQCSTSVLRQRLRAALDKFAPDVVAVPGWSGRLAFAAMIWCIQNRTPVVLMSESTPDDEQRVRWKEWIKRHYVGMCSAALVGGHRNQDYLLQLGMATERIFFGYDVVDNQYFTQHTNKVRESANAWRKRLGLPSRYFLASARFIEKKNLANLLRAYADYRAACHRSDAAGPLAAWDLVILGDGELRPQLDALREKLGLIQSTYLAGFKQYDELPPYYALAEAFIHASTKEPWGLVVNEAMAARLPVLVSNRCGCARTLVRESENGHSFDPNDVASMTQSMLAMSRTPDATRLEMAQRSEKIIAAFGPERFADGLCQAADVSLSSRAKTRSAWDSLLVHSLLAKSFRLRGSLS